MSNDSVSSRASDIELPDVSISNACVSAASVRLEACLTRTTATGRPAATRWQASISSATRATSCMAQAPGRHAVRLVHDEPHDCVDDAWQGRLERGRQAIAGIEGLHSDGHDEGCRGMAIQLLSKGDEAGR